MTASTGQRNAHVHMVTPDEARLEIDRMHARIGITRDELERRGDAWELDAPARGVLADIRGLEFLLERAASNK